MAPGHQEEARTEALLAFCRQAAIDDVAFILWAEELNTGHATLQEVEPWMEMVERVKPRLAAENITTSLNPWAVLLHADRGRVLKPGQDFQLMVDPEGRQASACACPLCPRLKEHLRSHFRRLAQVHPRVIWVDDDFRLHNHAPLQWGGCFCELHMAEYSRRAGRKVGREEFVRAVLQPGKPHPFRKVWLETSRDAMVDLARHIGDSVRSVSPDTQVGLMSSNPAVHCVEGRDWEGVLRGLAAGKAPVNRPHLPAYAEPAAPDYLWNFSRISRLSVAMVPPDTELYPELENWPHSRFSKSTSFTRFQVEAVAALGAPGITMDIFDIFGNGALLQEGYGPELAKAKQLATRLLNLGLDRHSESGVQVLFNRQASATVRTGKGQILSELEPDESFWAGFLATMGVAYTFREFAARTPGVTAVSGQYFRGLDEASIRRLLSDSIVLLNGDAVATLVDMGLGGLVGVRGAEWLAADSGIPSYEQVIDGREYAGVREGRLTAQALTGDYLRLEYAPGVELHTEVRNPSGNLSGPGMAVVNRRVVILPFGRGSSYVGLRHPVRQELLQSLLMELGGSQCPALLKGTANVAITSYDRKDRLAFLIMNASSDDLPALKLHLPGAATTGAKLVSANGEVPLEGRLRREGKDWVLEEGLASLGVQLLLAEKA